MRYEWMNPENLHFDKKSDALVFLRHKKAYEMAIEKIKNKNILEIGSGSGFGLSILSKHAAKITAIDRDDDALNNAKKININENIIFKKADIIKDGLNFEENQFDLVILFQVFEHIHPNDAINFLTSIKRVLKKGGVLLLTTPNRKTRLYPFQKPVNKYHQIEYTAKKLKKTLIKVFDKVEVLGLRANPEIEKIEKKRAKPTFLKTFLINPVKKFLPQKIKKLLSGQENISGKQEKTTMVKNNQDIFYGYTIDDFYLNSKSVNKSIDLYATSEK